MEKLNTPSPIDVSLVKWLIATQFPHWAHLPVKPVAFDGWDHRTFHLGDEKTVRLPSAAKYVQQVGKEQYWLPKLAPLLPLPIPVPLALGKPDKDYPWHWSVYRWLPGETATQGHIADRCAFATSLAAFLSALQCIDTSSGPVAGLHNFFRGGSLTVYDAETRQALTALEGKIDTVAAEGVWNAALAATWDGIPVWLHGDVSGGNLLVENGRLSAVIDFGAAGVGDPACDLAIAWTFFEGDNREAFREAMPADKGTWARGRGWALWKALIIYAQFPGSPTDPLEIEKCRLVIADVVADHIRFQ